MREDIGLFRGKPLNSSIWVSGNLWRYSSDGKTYILHKRGTSVEVDPTTIGEYTGLKDKNGKRIFEGDIIKLSEEVKQSFDVEDGEVRYGWGGFYVKEFSSLCSLNALSWYNIEMGLRGEVIGNIHDNPELLQLK